VGQDVADGPARQQRRTTRHRVVDAEDELPHSGVSASAGLDVF
jgi:hypothetical protein